MTYVKSWEDLGRNGVSVKDYPFDEKARQTVLNSPLSNSEKEVEKFMQDFCLATVNCVPDSEYLCLSPRERVYRLADNFDNSLNYQEVNIGADIDRSKFFADYSMKWFHRLTKRGNLFEYHEKPFIPRQDMKTFKQMIEGLEKFFITKLETFYDIFYHMFVEDAETSASSLRHSKNIPFDGTVLLRGKMHYDEFEPFETLDAESVTAFISSVRDSVHRLIPHCTWLTENDEWRKDAERSPILAFYRVDEDEYDYVRIMPENEKFDRKILSVKEWQYLGIYIRCHNLECPWIIDVYALDGKTMAFFDMGVSEERVKEMETCYKRHISLLANFQTRFGKRIEPVLKAQSEPSRRRYYELAYVYAFSMFYGLGKLDMVQVTTELDFGLMKLCKRIAQQKFVTIDMMTEDFNRLKLYGDYTDMFINFVLEKPFNDKNESVSVKFGSWRKQASELTDRLYADYHSIFVEK